jgi:hypothetical protein
LYESSVRAGGRGAEGTVKAAAALLADGPKLSGSWPGRIESAMVPDMAEEAEPEPDDGDIFASSLLRRSFTSHLLRVSSSSNTA